MRELSRVIAGGSDRFERSPLPGRSAHALAPFMLPGRGRMKWVGRSRRLDPISPGERAPSFLPAGENSCIRLRQSRLRVSERWFGMPNFLVDPLETAAPQTGLTPCIGPGRDLFERLQNSVSARARGFVAGLRHDTSRPLRACLLPPLSKLVITQQRPGPVVGRRWATSIT